MLENRHTHRSTRSTSFALLKPLVERYVQGDDHAFAALYTTLAPWLTRRLRKLLRAPTQIDDVVQTVFLKLHHTRARFRVGEPIAPYLWVIARRLALDLLRRVPHETIDDALCLSTEPSPHDLLEAKCTSLRLAETYDALPAAYRAAFMLVRLDGIEQRVVAERLGTTVAAVKLRTFRATQRLRAALDDQTRPSDLPSHGWRDHALAQALD